MRLSARNVLKGKIKKITDGVVNTEVVVDFPAGRRSFDHHQEFVAEPWPCGRKGCLLPSSRRVV